MPYLLVVILEDLQHLPDLLQAWQAIDVPGVTIMKSVGGYQAHTWLGRAGLGALDRLFEAEEVQRRTLLVTVEDEALLEQAIAEAERVVGGFERPHSGLVMAVPVTHVRGLRKVEPKQVEVELPPAVRPGWIVQRDTPVEVVLDVLDLEPSVIPPETPLDEVARTMLTRCNVHVACVTSKDGRLIGLLRLRALADDLFFHIMPEEFMSEITDLDRLMQYADKSRMRTAADAMQEPVWVKRDDTVKDAFKRMHEHGLSGLPVVDDQYHVVGYINLLELLAVCIEREEETATSSETET